MSQKSLRSQRNNRSQVSNSSRVQDLSLISQSQPSTQKLNVPDELVHKCVRFFLIKMGSNVPIKRAQIVQSVFKERPGRIFDIILKKTSVILKEVYGLNIVIIDGETSNKKYVVTNVLEYGGLIDSSDEDKLKTSIRFLVLTHIFMSKNSATETSLWEFLKVLNIRPEKKLNDTGDVYTFVLKQLVKEQYIQLDTGSASYDDGESITKFMWGTRAEECVSKMEILKFVAEMYGRTKVTHWKSRYESALNQPGFINKENNVEMVEIDD